jgi:FixJ family two-component response regulator
MSASSGIVYLLDDEPDLVKALSRLLRARGFDVRAFTSVTAFLEAYRPESAACLVLDVAMPELDGLELQNLLRQRGLALPIVFLTGHGDIPMSVRAIKAGASDFLTKPADAAQLIPAVRAALQTAHTRHQTLGETRVWESRLASLTPREREILQHVVAGRLNKQIAADLGTGEQNVKQHRAHIMSKMGVESLAELVRAVERFDLGHGRAGIVDR